MSAENFKFAAQFFSVPNGDFQSQFFWQNIFQQDKIWGGGRIVSCPLTRREWLQVGVSVRLRCRCWDADVKTGRQVDTWWSWRSRRSRPRWSRPQASTSSGPAPVALNQHDRSQLHGLFRPLSVYNIIHATHVGLYHARINRHFVLLFDHARPTTHVSVRIRCGAVAFRKLLETLNSEKKLCYSALNIKVTNAGKYSDKSYWVTTRYSGQSAKWKEEM